MKASFVPKAGSWATFRFRTPLPSRASAFAYAALPRDKFQGLTAERPAGQTETLQPQLFEELTRVAALALRHLVRRARDDDLPAGRPALGTYIYNMVGDLMTSRLCSMTMTVLPRSTSLFSTSSSRRMSSK